MLSPDTMVPVENHQGFTESWGGIAIPARSTRKIPYRIAKTLRNDPNFRVILDGFEDLFPLVDERGVNLEYRSMMDMRDGYGSCSPFIAMALERAGFYVHFKTHGYCHDPGVPGRALELANRPHDQECLLGITANFPGDIHTGVGVHKFGFTMFETDRIPQRFVDSCNRVHGLFLPCHQNREAFQNSGVTTPIYVTPLGVDSDTWPLHDRKPDRKTRPFTFGCFGTLTGRKNVILAIRGFREAFSHGEDVRVLFKTRGSNFGQGMNAYADDIQGDPRISIINKCYSPEEMIALLHNEIDCLVFPSKGEGFGLPPLQAMSTGMPVIVADHSGMSEYVDERYNYSIKTCPMVASYEYPDSWGNVGNWWDPDQDECTSLMRHVYDHQDEAYAKGMAAAQWVREKFTWDNTVSCMIDGLEQVVPDIRESLRTNPAHVGVDVGESKLTARPKDMFLNVLVSAHGQVIATANAIGMTSRAMDRNGIAGRFWLLDNGSPAESGVYRMFQEMQESEPGKFVAIRGSKKLDEDDSRTMLLESWKHRGPEGPHECVMVLSNETEWHEVDGFGRMCDVLWRSGVMVVGVKGYFLPPEDSGERWSECNSSTAFGNEVDVVTGACQVFHRDLIDRCGIPKNSLDLCQRARAVGLRILAVGQTGFRHLGKDAEDEHCKNGGIDHV